MVSLSTAEAKYVAASACCSQVLLIQNQLMDYGLNLLLTPIHIDNTAAMFLSKNHVQHSKAKHIETHIHFIRDCAEKKLIELVQVPTDLQLADIFTKAYDKKRFEYLITTLGMINLE